jgi:hypothetical protein
MIATSVRGGETPIESEGPFCPRHSHMYATTTRGVSHCGLAIYIKNYLKAKEELWKLKYFTMQKT